MKSEEKSRDGPRLAAAAVVVVVLLRLLLLPLKPPGNIGLPCDLGESGEGIGEAGLLGQLHLLLVARRLSGLNPSAGSKTG